MTESPVEYVKDFLPPDMARGAFERLMNIDWERRPDAPRAEYWSNDFDTDYTYMQIAEGPSQIDTLEAPLREAYSRIYQNGMTFQAFVDSIRSHPNDPLHEAARAYNSAVHKMQNER